MFVFQYRRRYCLLDQLVSRDSLNRLESKFKEKRNLGTGKTATVMSHLKELPKEEYLTNVVNCSARTTAQQMQELVMSKLDRRRKGVFGPPVGKKVISQFFHFFQLTRLHFTKIFHLLVPNIC